MNRVCSIVRSPTAISPGWSWAWPVTTAHNGIWCGWDHRRRSRGKRGVWFKRAVLDSGLASLFSERNRGTVAALLADPLAPEGMVASVLGALEGAADGGLASAAKLNGGEWTNRQRARKPPCTAGCMARALAALVIAVAWHGSAVLTGRTGPVSEFSCQTSR